MVQIQFKRLKVRSAERTRKKPTKWMVVLMSLYLQGVATDEDVLRTLNKPDNRGIKLRAKDELWKKLGF